MSRFATYTLLSDTPIYQQMYKVLNKSLKKYLPYWDHLVFDYDTTPDIVERVCTDRPQRALELFEAGYEGVLHIGADCELFAPPKLPTGYECILTPHCLEPYPEDGKSPSDVSVYWSGIMNSDFVWWRNTPAVKKFLEWQSRMIKQRKSNTFLDQQPWLQYAVAHLDTYVIRDKRYNVAYFNLTEQKRCEIIRDKKVVMAQFSGLDFDKPEAVSLGRLSVHTNRRIKDPHVVKFYQDYMQRVKEEFSSKQ